MMYLLYENFKLRILLAIQPVKSIIDKEDGRLYIERNADDSELSFRMEGYSEAMQVVINRFLVTIRPEKAVKG